MDWGIIAILIAGLIGALEVVSILVVRHDIQSYKDQLEERGDIGDQLDEWLMTKESDEPDAPTRLEALTTVIGQILYRSTHMAGLQEKSVDSRVVNQYSAKIQAAVKQKLPLGYKLLFKIANELGFNLEEIMDKGELTQFYEAAKANRLDLLLGNDGAVSSSNLM